MQVNLWPKQTIAIDSTANEILYGGAAGPGKSFLIRVAAIQWCFQVPNLQIYLFRREFPDLMRNHMQGSGNFYELLSEFIDAKIVKITQNPLEIDFPNGAKINLCHCQHEKDVYAYQGAEIHVLLIDELTTFTEFQYRFLRSRVRLGGLTIPTGLDNTFPRILCGSNPGNVGHEWVKRMFIDSGKPFEVRRAPNEEGGLLRQYIPAKLEDNPTMMKNDPDYKRRLEGLGSPELVRAMLEGDWDITAGAALEKLTRDRCIVRNFTVPQHFTKYTVIDWGTYRPFAVGWFCVTDEDMILKEKEHWPEKLIPKNSIIMYREWYGWNGRANEGCRMESPEVAQKIIEIEEEAGEKMDFRVGDSAMWSKVDGPSVAERMYKATNGLYNMRQSIKDRANNYQEIRARVAGEDDTPFFYATENCLHFWRTVPTLQLDQLHPEKGPDTDQEDHFFDVLSYSCASRPYTKSRRDRVKADYDSARSKIHGARGRYETK